MKLDNLLREYNQSIEKKDYNGALKAIRKVLSSDSNNFEGWFNLAKLYIEHLNQKDKGLQTIQRGLKHYKNNVKLLELQAKTLFDMERMEQSYGTAKTLIQINPDNNSIWELIDKIYFVKKSLQHEIKMFRKSLFEEYRRIGDEHLQNNQLTDTIICYERALRINPDNEQIQYDLARLYTRQKNFLISQKYVTKMKKNNPNDFSLLKLEMKNEYQLQNFEKAYELYDQFLKIYPNKKVEKRVFDELQKKLFDKFLKKGIETFEEKKFESSSENIKKALVYDPQNKEALEMESKIKDLMTNYGKLKQAEQNYSFLKFLSTESEINSEISLSEILAKMPQHSAVTNEESLRTLLKLLMLQKNLSGSLTPTGLKFDKNGISTISIESSISMPNCPVCNEAFPMELYSKTKKGDVLICEYCGSPFTKN